jgi:hypothetical protein
MPQLDRAENYQSKFEKFKKLYHALQNINK